VHTLSALAVAEKIVLAHFEVDGKTNEIPCVPALIRQLGLAGVIYTGDAMNCQKETFRAAAESNSYVLAQVKGNQPTLLHSLEDLADHRPPIDRCEVKDKIAHGRQERRRVETFDIAGSLGPDWDELVVTAARVTRLTWHKDTTDGMWTASTDSAIYLCQKSLSAADFGAAIRGHWEVEAHHYVRDVTLAEDASRIRINPLNFARLRTIALNILRANGVKNVGQALFRNALNLENILSYSLS
jgi:predicted transposase YbfD/YdcC